MATGWAFALAARLILGAVFMYASIDKILHPAAFTKAVYNYAILPDALINLTAIVLPWLELVLGIFLVIGLFREGSVCIVTGLLVVFMGDTIFNMARGLDIYCGCFSASMEGHKQCSRHGMCSGTVFSCCWHATCSTMPFRGKGGR